MPSHGIPGELAEVALNGPPILTDRQLHLDALKLVGSQLILLHHFSTYGPMADAVAEIAPGTIRWFFDYARMAVQIFLVVGGFLSVQALSSVAQREGKALLRAVGRRYQRLVLPFLAALLFAVLSASLTRDWLSADFVPASPSADQVLAHALLLNGILGQASLSAGIWYVAIDLQLFAGLALLLWVGQRSKRPWLAPALVLGLVAASLFGFNRDEAWDNWALYFFGAYGLGVLVYWIRQTSRPWSMMVLLAGLVLLALFVDFRTRIALALAVALLLAMAPRGRPASQGLPAWLLRATQTLGRSSYAVFLLHFPVLMLVSALYVSLGWSGPGPAMTGLALGWTASILLGLAFERWVERPLTRLRLA